MIVFCSSDENMELKQLINPYRSTADGHIAYVDVWKNVVQVTGRIDPTPVTASVVKRMEPEGKRYYRKFVPDKEDPMKAHANVYCIGDAFKKVFPSAIPGHQMAFKKLCFSDEIVSLHDILHRFYCAEQVVLSAENPRFFAYNINVCKWDDTAPWTSADGFTTGTPFQILTGCFLFRSGGYEWKLIRRPGGVSGSPLVDDGVIYITAGSQMRQSDGYITPAHMQVAPGCVVPSGPGGIIVEDMRTKTSIEWSQPFYSKYPFVGNAPHWPNQMEESNSFVTLDTVPTAGAMAAYHLFHAVKDDFTLGVWSGAAVQVGYTT